jgi:thymidylate synthase (FAD)
MKAELIDIMGDDLAVVNAARVSYGKEKQEFDDKDERLIAYLLEHGHTSPFRHVILKYRIECPIYVERQLFKHQIGMSANSISGRYVDFSDSYHKIDQFRYQSGSSKQGSAGNLNLQRMKTRLCGSRRQ